MQTWLEKRVSFFVVTTRRRLSSRRVAASHRHQGSTPNRSRAPCPVMTRSSSIINSSSSSSQQQQQSAAAAAAVSSSSSSQQQQSAAAAVVWIISAGSPRGSARSVSNAHLCEAVVDGGPPGGERLRICVLVKPRRLYRGKVRKHNPLSLPSLCVPSLSW